MRAEQLAGLLVEDRLDHALVLAERNRLAVADEREAADADVELLLLRRLLGQADRGDLRLRNRCSPGSSACPSDAGAGP